MQIDGYLLSLIEEFPDFLPNTYSNQQRFKSMMFRLFKKTINLPSDTTKLVKSISKQLLLSHLAENTSNSANTVNNFLQELIYNLNKSCQIKTWSIYFSPWNIN